MIRINLLSPLDKENLKWEKINNLALKSIIWVLLAMAISVGFFLCSIEYLKTEKDAAAAELVSIKSLPAMREVDTIEKSLRQDKSKVEDIYAIQTGHVRWATLFENIAGLTPAGVRLTDIILQEEVATAVSTGGGMMDIAAQQEDAAAAPDYAAEAAAIQKAVKEEDTKIKVQISGNAKTRELLLDLEGSLKSSDVFFDLQYDTGNYVESTDIDFLYTFYIDKQKLLK